MTSTIVPPVDLAPNMPSRVVTISATDVTEGGQSLEGQMVRFALSDTLDVSSGGDVIAKTQAEVVLDTNGEGRIRLPVYDENVKTWCGKDWAILVTATWGSQKAIRVPAGTSSIALSALPPVRPLRGREKQWAITGASASVTQGTSWDISVALRGGILDFLFQVPQAQPAPVTVLGTENLNTLLTAGGYRQPSNGNAAPASNYPTPFAGHLLVMPRDAGAVVQLYAPIGGPGRLYTRTGTGTGAVWSEWAQVLTDKDPRIELAGSDLNTVVTPKKYVQSVAAAATTARNYPALFSGLLDVELRGGGAVMQTYRPFGGTVRMLVRYTVDGGAVWSPWKAIDTDTTEFARTEDLPALIADEIDKPGVIDRIGLLTPEVADARYSGIGWAEGVIQKEDTIRRGKFGKIGTAGKPVIAWRIDHQTDEFIEKVLPLMVARSIPCGIGLVTQSVGQPFGGPTGYEPTDATWQDVHDIVFAQGAEIWSHSRTHGNGPAGGDEGLYSEIVGSMEDIWAQGLLPMGWQQPGGPSDYGPHHTTAEAMDDTAGRLIRMAYPLYEANLAGSTIRMLPTNGCRGLNHITVESLTPQAVIDWIDRTVRMGSAGLEIMIHPNQLDIPGLMSTAGLTQVLDYVADLRDTGVIEVLTPSGLAYADPTSDHRPSLITGGDFPTATPTPEWSLGSATIGTDGGHTGPNYLRAGAGVTATYNLLGANGYGIQGHVVYFQGWVRTTGTWRVRAIASTTAGSKYPFDRTGTGDGSWQFVRIPFGMPLNVGNFYLPIGSQSGQVDWDDIEIVAA